MGCFKRFGYTLVFLTALDLALSSSVSSSFYKASLGGTYDEERITKVELIVPIESSLFGTGNSYNEDAVTSLKDLALSCSSYCKRLDQVEGKPYLLSCNHSKLAWSLAGSEEPLSSEIVKNLKHKYDLALQELVEAQDLEVEHIKSTVLQNAIRPVAQRLPKPKGTTVNIVGCTSGSDLVIELTSDAAVDDDIPIKMLEVADYGRFVNDKKAFVRIAIAQYWAHNKDKGAWYHVDFERCDRSDRPIGFVCPKSALTYANECTPADVNDCPVEVNFVKGNFVTNFYMPNGSMVIASNMQQFNTHDSLYEIMPASGVILADLTFDARILFGQVKIKPTEGAAMPFFRWTPVNTEGRMAFADACVYYDADFDPSGWAFELSTDGSGDIIVIEGRRIGSAAFIGDNLWWCLVASVAIVLGVVLTLLTLFYRGRISSSIRHYSGLHG